MDEIKRLRKKVDITRIIDFEKMQTGVLEKDLEYFQYLKQEWLTKKKGVPLEIVADFVVVFPHPWCDGFYPEKIKAFLESIKDKFIRQLFCEVVIGDCIYNEEHWQAIRKFSEFLEKEKLV